MSKLAVIEALEQVLGGEYHANDKKHQPYFEFKNGIQTPCNVMPTKIRFGKYGTFVDEDMGQPEVLFNLVNTIAMVIQDTPNTRGIEVARMFDSSKIPDLIFAFSA